jgi:aspartyl/asparaginyl beta-hydroxylase (cupin superfamily)
LFDEAGGAASWTVPSCSFAARQQTMPAILLSRTMVDDGFIRAAAKNNDWGFYSFFKSGWKRFYLK